MNLVVAHALSRPTSNGRLDPNGEDFVVGINDSGLRGRQPGSAASFVATLNSDGGFRTEPGEHLIPIQDVRGQRDNRLNGMGVGDHGDPMFTLDSVSRHAVGVRRLTPLECERLQGFPDGWTCLCGTDDYELGCKCPDSPRYRALGNAVTVNVIRWLGRRLPSATQIRKTG